MFRSGWRDTDDAALTSVGSAGMVCGMGVNSGFPVPPVGPVTYTRRDGDTVVVGMRFHRPKSSLEGVSSLAFDRSGLSGAPVLLAGVAVKRQIRKGPRSPSDDMPREIGGRPRAPRRRRASTAPPVEEPKPRRREEPAAVFTPASGKISQLTAGGAEFTILTIQRGRPPEPKVIGKGKDQKIVIGKRTLAFDGQKIVLGKP